MYGKVSELYGEVKGAEQNVPRTNVCVKTRGGHILYLHKDSVRTPRKTEIWLPVKGRGGNGPTEDGVCLF